MEAAGDLIGNKIADKITRVSKKSPNNNLERFIISELGHKFINDLRLRKENYWLF